MTTLVDILFKADTRQLDDAKGKLSGLNDTVNKMPGSVSTAEGAMARLAGSLTTVASVSTLAATALAGLMSHVISVYSALDDMSDQTGIAIEQLSIMTQLADKSGLSYEKLTSSITFYQRALGEANDKSSEQARALAALGLNAKDLAKEQDQGIQTIAKALDKYEDGVNKNIITMKLFGKTGTELNDWMKEYANNTTVSAKHTKEMNDKVEQLTKDWAVMKTTASNLAVEIGGPLVNALADTVRWFSKSQEAGQKWSDWWADERKKFAQQLGLPSAVDATTGAAPYRVSPDTLKPEAGPKLTAPEIPAAPKKTGSGHGPNMDSEIKSLQQQYYALQDISKEQQIINKYAEAYYSKYPKEQVAEAKRLELLVNEIKSRKEHEQALNKIMEDSSNALQRSVQSENERLMSLIRANEEENIRYTILKDVNKTTTDATIAVEEYRLALMEQSLASMQAVEGTEDEIAALENKIATQRKVVEENKKQKQTEEDRRPKTFEDGWTNAFDKYKKNANDAALSGANAFTAASGAMEQALTSFATTGKLSFKGLLSSMLQEIARFMAQKAVISFVTSILGMIGSAYAGGSTGGSSGSWSNSTPGYSGSDLGSGITMSSMGNVFGTSGHLTAYASGGVVNGPNNFAHAGGRGLVGEAGPEAIMPLRRLPSGQLGVAATGGNGGTTFVNNITVNVSGDDKKDKDENGQAIAKAIRENLKVLINQQLQENTRAGNQLNPTPMTAF